MNPESVLASQETLNRIEKACRRLFFNEPDVVECTTHVIDTLRQDDFKRLRSFKGKSRQKTFLYTLINNAAIDCHRKRCGRFRPPEAVKRLGKAATNIYRLICLDRFSFEESYEILCSKREFTGPFQEYETRFQEIRKQGCPETLQWASNPTDPDNPAADPQDVNQPNPLEQLIESLDREKRIQTLTILKEATDALPEDDRLLVNLVYGEDHSAAAAAKALGIPPHQARNRLKTLLTGFKEKLLAKGIRKP